MKLEKGHPGKVSSTFSIRTKVEPMYALFQTYTLPTFDILRKLYSGCKYFVFDIDFKFLYTYLSVTLSAALVENYATDFRKI